MTGAREGVGLIGTATYHVGQRHLIPVSGSVLRRQFGTAFSIILARKQTQLPSQFAVLPWQSKRAFGKRVGQFPVLGELKNVANSRASELTRQFSEFCVFSLGILRRNPNTGGDGPASGAPRQK